MNESIFRIGRYDFTIGSLVGVLIVILSALVVLRITRATISRRAAKNPEQSSRLSSAYLLVKYFVWLLSGAIILRVLEADLTFLVAGSAALLVGIGLGIQSTFNDIVSGIIILLEGTIRVGDVLEVSGLVGRVKVINLRTSTVFTRDGMNVIVPNSSFINEKVVNWSHNALETRFRLTVGVAYGSEEKKVHAILMAAASEHAMVISDNPSHPTLVRLIDFGDSSLDFEVLFWSRNIFYIEQTKSEMRFDILQRFREAGVTIPFPQRDVHLIPQAPST